MAPNERLTDFHRGFGMLRPLNAPEAREPRTGRQPTTTEADVRPLRSFFEASLPASGIASCEAISTLRLYFRRHFKAATSVPPLDHVRVRPGAGYVLRTDFFISLCLVHSLLLTLRVPGKQGLIRRTAQKLPYRKAGRRSGAIQPQAACAPSLRRTRYKW